MVYQRFVQPGRVALVTYGPDAGQLACIVDVVDARHVLVNGLGGKGIARQKLNFKRLALTDLVVPNVLPGASNAVVNERATKDGTLAKWEGSAWARRLAVKKARAAASDFTRFQIMMMKQKKRAIVRKTLKTVVVERKAASDKSQAARVASRVAKAKAKAAAEAAKAKAAKGKGASGSKGGKK